jgi:cell division protease FtsH
MEHRVIAILGGKAATEVCFGETDVGANSDLHRDFDICERFVDDYCTNSFDRWIQGRESSNGVSERRDMQLAVEMEKFYHTAKKILIDNREFLDKLASALMQKDVLTSVEIQEIKATCKKVA